MTDFEHTGSADCCVVCAVDDFWRWLGERYETRRRVKEQRGRELSDMWRDYGGEAG